MPEEKGIRVLSEERTFNKGCDSMPVDASEDGKCGWGIGIV
jgi:hypothetical protein